MQKTKQVLDEPRQTIIGGPAFLPPRQFPKEVTPSTFIRGKVNFKKIKKQIFDGQGQLESNKGPRNYNIIGYTEIKSYSQFQQPKERKRESFQKNLINYFLDLPLIMPSLTQEQQTFSRTQIEKHFNIPYTNLMNAPGYEYNPILDIKVHSQKSLSALKNENKAITHKQQQIAYFKGDTMDRVYSRKNDYNPDYQKLYKEEPQWTRRSKGMCASDCEMAKNYFKHQFRKFK